ncbi:glycosyltransferase [Streptoalloteichus tenebrarius]|uniref:glycosyltransferase n=1 Tax=Streptoalloteichus tenebrarius (strain ATCC 17920 / DSM 40477 / JCM 4838 / CBS 697.72 / NBRC 16177 / NCIMB 11028 / NRRL B-12390 / A12253. 1 / ISP 5477) TaxID=1933 RepID=UPI0020A59509|nr:glycosyltransferase [Streptoalloteichus tenebrarius]
MTWTRPAAAIRSSSSAARAAEPLARAEAGRGRASRQTLFGTNTQPRSRVARTDATGPGSPARNDRTEGRDRNTSGSSPEAGHAGGLTHVDQKTSAESIPARTRRHISSHSPKVDRSETRQIISWAERDGTVRILFTFVGGTGHFAPLTPIARAAEAAGHTVAFTAEPPMASPVREAGFTVFPAGVGREGAPERLPLLEVDREREDRVVRENFARHRAGRRASALLPLCQEWRPDLLVCEEMDFGALVAAERLGIPHARVLVIASGSFVRTELVAEPLHTLRAEHGLAPDPDLAMLERHLVLAPFPPSFRHPAYPLPATAHALRPHVLDESATPPAWLDDLADAPTVYLTLGTIFNMESGDLFSRAITGLRELPVNLVVTVGRHLDPAEFGPQPANVHIERFVPQAAILPRCAAVVSHGGSGSVMGALAHGLPMVLLPMGADQPHNADRCEDLGVAEVLDAVGSTPETIRDAVSRVLSQPSYRCAAERLRDEMVALPGPEHAVSLLERLAA